MEKDVLFGLKQGNSVLKELNREMSIENVEKLMGETADAIAYQQVRSPNTDWTQFKMLMLSMFAPQEVDEMLASRMSAEDEDAVQAEVEAMEAELASDRTQPRSECVLTIVIACRASRKSPSCQMPRKPICRRSSTRWRCPQKQRVSITYNDRGIPYSR